jgi:hypothetical protein
MPNSSSTQSVIQLEARPQGLFLNCGYGIYDGSRRVATIKFDNSALGFLDVLGLSALWSRGYRGRIMTPSARYRLRHKQKLGRTHTWLLQKKTPIAEADDRLIPPGVSLQHNDREYCLRPSGNEIRVITVDGQPVGSVKEPGPFFSRKIHFLMPKSLPLTHQLLMMWIYLDGLGE